MVIEMQNETHTKKINPAINFKEFEKANKSILSTFDNKSSKVPISHLSIPQDMLSQFEKIAEINSLIAKQIADPEFSSVEQIEKLNDEVNSTLKIPELLIRQMQSLDEMNKNLTSDFQIPKDTLNSIKDIHKTNINNIKKANDAIEQITKIDPYYLSSLDPILYLAFKWDGVLDSIAKSLDFENNDGSGNFESLPELNELYLLWKNKDSAKIDAFFDSWFSNKTSVDNLIYCLGENDLFKPRMHIIEKALHAHLNGDYELSIPILLSQLDGIFLDRCKGSSSACVDCGMGSVVFNNGVNKRIGGRERNYFCFDSNNVSRKILRQDNDYMCFFLDHILKTFEVIRHDILHGIKVDYPEKDFSTKLIVSMVNLNYAKKEV